MDAAHTHSSATAGTGSLLRRWLGELPIYLTGLTLMAFCIGLLMSYGVSPSVSGVIENARLFALFTLIAVLFDSAWQINRERPKSPIAFLKARYLNRALWHTIAKGLPLLAVAILVLPFFSKMKAAIPLFNDFVWDEAFIAWDRAIFFGYDAWQVMQPVLGFPIVTATFALMYHLWFLMLYPGVMFFVFMRMDSRVRRPFFMTYMLSWAVIGGAMATWLASVGPVFIGPMLGNPHFDAQMAYLNSANEQIPIMTLRVQALLLEWHGVGKDGLGSGITAMPSMHCAIAFLYWLAVRRIHAGWGKAFAAFFFIIWVGSVHLAYHYAVDGLVSLIAVAAIWKLSEATFALWDKWIEARAQAVLRTNTVPAE